MLRARYSKYLLDFKKPAGTSRGVLRQKETWFLKIWDDADPDVCGIGECALFRGLSFDDVVGYEGKLATICRDFSADVLSDEELDRWPSMRFGIETALMDLKNGGRRILKDSAFTEGTLGITINGLIWMSSSEDMLRQIREKLGQGFRCLKLKVGALDFGDELSLLSLIRREFSPADLELRLDSNGAFAPAEALEKLNVLSAFNIHSIEQPIRQGQADEMAKICALSPIPVALDEELIGVVPGEAGRSLLAHIKPRYIILKPSLHGGFSGAREWVRLASGLEIGYWYTSALESNIGLNAIAQTVAAQGFSLPQGLGTGSLFTNNIGSPLEVDGEKLWYRPGRHWNLEPLTGW